MFLSGATLFAGDSITVGLPGFVKVDGSKTVVAEGGRTSEWLLERLRGLDRAGELAKHQNMVVLIGTNDIAGGLSAPRIFENIEAIYRLAKSRGLRLFALTLPPVKGWSAFEGNFGTVDAKRRGINTLIEHSPFPDKVVRLDILLASPQDPLRLAPSFDSGDHLHPRKDALGEVLTRELATQLPAPLGGPIQVPAPSSTGLLLLVGLGGIATYLLTRKRRPSW